jgi:diguanylate cyclase (GGDEF)-like protein
VNLNAAGGVLAQVQVLVSIWIVLIPKKRHYWIAVGLNIAQCLMVLYAILFRGAAESIPGLLVAVSTIISITIIHNYGQRLNNHIEKVTKQNEELTSLYARDQEKGERLRHQNEQLIRYNRLLEKKEKVLHHIAYHDGLTELPNRKMMIDRMDQLTKPATGKESFAFVFIDLDNFKIVNDTMGHSFGDKVLKIIANRWKKIVHKDDMFARFGGDEFALLIQRSLSEEELLKYVESFQKVLCDAISVKHKSLYINFSCGITLYPKDAANTTELLKNADMALYTVKNNKKNGIQFYTSQMQELILKRVKMEQCLKSSLKNGEIYVVFQPLYHCVTKKLRGFEVLARWTSRELGTVSPVQFIPIAEETGFIVEMGRWILRTVLSKMVSLQKFCLFKPVVSINISVIQMMEPSFVPMVKKVLEETGFEGQYLEMEITESVFISYPEKFITVIQQLNSLGIKVALDDFGTGYASLNYLQTLPINTLKIDKTFIDRIQQDGKKIIVGNIIDLAHELNFEVVAEGVETQVQLDYLADRQCNYFQGYLFSKPLDEEKMRQLLTQQTI